MRLLFILLVMVCTSVHAQELPPAPPDHNVLPSFGPPELPDLAAPVGVLAFTGIIAGALLTSDSSGEELAPAVGIFGGVIAGGCLAFSIHEHKKKRAVTLSLR